MTSRIFRIIFDDFAFKDDFPYIFRAYHSIRVKHLPHCVRQEKQFFFCFLTYQI